MATPPGNIFGGRAARRQQLNSPPFRPPPGRVNYGRGVPFSRGDELEPCFPHWGLNAILTAIPPG